MSNIKEGRYKPRLHVSATFSWSMVDILHDSIVIIKMCTRPQAILLAMTTMRKSIHGISFLSYTSTALHLATLWSTGAPIRLV